MPVQPQSRFKPNTSLKSGQAGWNTTATSGSIWKAQLLSYADSKRNLRQSRRACLRIPCAGSTAQAASYQGPQT